MIRIVQNTRKSNSPNKHQKEKHPTDSQFDSTNQIAVGKNALQQNSSAVAEDELALFRETVKGAKKIESDTHFFSRQSSAKSANSFTASAIDNQSQQDNKIASSFQFSDIYQPNLPTEGPMRYLQAGVDSFELKRLKRGDYIPELFLDLHGLTQQQAKRELSALLAACIKENVQCACVMHGYGKNILRQQVPFWLAQHPSVLAFHQATKEWGGDAALLVLMQVEEDQLLRR